MENNNNYTDHIRHILQSSREEARRLHSRVIRTEHCLLGILRDGNGKAIEAMRRQGVDFDVLRNSLEWQIAKAEDLDPSPEVIATENDEEAFTKEAGRTLKLSQLEARMLHQPTIGSEHILLAMLKDKRSTISQIMSHFDVDYSSFQRTVQEIYGMAVRKTSPDDDPFSSVFGRISDKRHEKEEEEPEDEWSEAGPSDFMADEENPSDNNRKATATDAKNENENSETPTLDRFGFDITNAAREGKLDPVVGREKEIERLAQILSRRKKNNPILLGEPGVGKTAIVEGLAQRIVERKVSFLLKNKRIVSLDMAGLVAGTKYRGQFEERLKGIMREVSGNPDIILYIDEIHTMVGAGNAEGSMDAANMLKPALSRGEMQCIGSTTVDEFRKTIEKDGALERRFQKVMVEPTSAADTLTILHNIRGRYEDHHCVRFSEDALQACVTMADRYISDRNFPDKAIDVMDEAGSRMHLMSAHERKSIEDLENQLCVVRQRKDEAILSQEYELAATFRDRERTLEEQIKADYKQMEREDRAAAPTIDADKIAEVVAQMTNIPVQKVASSESQKLLRLQETLQAHVIGQDDAIRKVVRAIQRNRIGLKDPKRPIGTFLFLGPTGVGKTYLAKKIADELFASADSLIRIDMSEYMEKYSTSRLIGAAPGYVGYEQGGQLTERVRRHPYSVILFDEVEKADHEVFNLLLQLFDEGHLTDSTGRKVDFKNCIIILTSNVGSRQLGDFGTGIGFQDFTEEQRQAANEAVLRKELKKTFSPEFLNRIDDIIPFRQLTHDDIRRIVDVELTPVIDRIKAQGYDVEVTDAMKDFLAKRGYDPKFGARPLRRAIQEHIEDALCERILSDQSSAKNAEELDLKESIVIDAPKE
ncbi:MAG: ATP-dependent Clp protease ATP-binding subunit [Bacteroidales bacterium]|jgi:ATP-dependent Clp protease ATP-binding subunit ClpC|nr:ATP-dependent Clp protease ATP-binding subunit [Bacteroidales bacterium]